MVSSKVHLCEDVQIILYLRAVGKGESHALEYLYNLILYNRKRMASTQFYRVCSTCEVKFAGITFFTICKLAAKTIDSIKGKLLELINPHTYSLLIFCCNILEVSHQSLQFSLT